MVKTIEKSIDLSTIDLDDDLYRISGASGIDAIAESIRNIGLVNFPILQEKTPGIYRIVCGFKRIFACRRLSVPSTRCRVIDGPCSHIDCLKLSITDNAMASRPGIIEEARAVTKLRSLCLPEEDLPSIARTLGMSVNMALVEKYEVLCRLPENLRQLLEDDIISMKIAIDLSGLDHETALAIAGLFVSLRPTASHQKELIAGLRAISAMRDIPVSHLLDTPLLAGITTNDNLDRKQKIQWLRAEIRRMRYPHMTRFESSFYRNLKKMRLPDGVTLHAPRDFESPVHTFAIDFKDTAELRRKAALLKELCESKELTSILKREIEDTQGLY